MNPDYLGTLRHGNPFKIWENHLQKSPCHFFGVTRPIRYAKNRSWPFMHRFLSGPEQKWQKRCRKHESGLFGDTATWEPLQNLGKPPQKITLSFFRCYKANPLCQKSILAVYAPIFEWP